MKYTINEIDKRTALAMVQQYHYSATLPKLNKFFLGFYINAELVGVVTLGWGTRPLHTIKRIFPSLASADYLEIGRMCMTDLMPRNSESQMLSQLVKWLKQNHPEVKVLFTWADGMLGKVGYVYQASNFIYAGYSGGEMYIKDGLKVHVRSMKQFILPQGVKDDRISVRPTLAQLGEFNIEHYKGKQYRYLYFLCDKQTQKRLRNECLIELNLPRSKDNDLGWTKRNTLTGKWEQSPRPHYITDANKDNLNLHNNEPQQLMLFSMEA